MSNFWKWKTEDKQPSEWDLFVAKYSTSNDEDQKRKDCAKAYIEGLMPPQDIKDYEYMWRGWRCMFEELNIRISRLESK